MARCSICRKSATSGSNVSHAQNHTKRKFKPNLQKVNGMLLCSKCIKTIKKMNEEDAIKIEEMAEKNENKLEKTTPAKKIIKKIPSVEKPVSTKNKSDKK